VGLAARPPRRGPSSARRVCQAARAAPLTVHETAANLQRLPRAGAPVAQLAARKAELAAAARAAAALGPLRAELDAARAELRALQRAAGAAERAPAEQRGGGGGRAAGGRLRDAEAAAAEREQRLREADAALAEREARLRELRAEVAPGPAPAAPAVGACLLLPQLLRSTTQPCHQQRAAPNLLCAW